MRICKFLVVLSCLFAEEEISKSNFPVRLTPEEQAEAQNPRQTSSGCCNGSTNSCCPSYEPAACPAPCCEPPSLNCPPIMPRCAPCDCILDYYNPLVFNGWDLSIEWLFWTVQQKSSTFVLSPNGINQPFPPSALSDAIGKYQSAKFDWNSGVRAACSYTFERDAWNLMGQYTFYKTDGSKVVHRPSSPFQYLEPTSREVNISSFGVSEMKSSTDFHYQVFDLLLSRRFLPGCQILFNFFAGPTCALIYEKWNVKGVDVGTNPNVTTKTKNTWTFQGAGMRGGLDANWHLGGGFGLYNKFSFATVVGAYQNKKTCAVTATGNANSVISSLLSPYIWDTTQNDTWIVPATQLEFGLNWNHRFCHWAIALEAAFEINTWYDLHQYQQAGDASLTASSAEKFEYRNASPVSLWGTTTRLNFSF